MKAKRQGNFSASQLSIHSAPPALELPRLALYKKLDASRPRFVTLRSSWNRIKLHSGGQRRQLLCFL